MKNTLFLALFVLAFASCNGPKPEEKEPISEGSWLGELALNDSTTLSFIYTVAGADTPQVVVLNGAEKIALTTAFYSADSIVLNFPVYQTRLLAKTGADVWTGYFEKLDSPEEYRVPFVGSFGFDDRLPNVEPACCPLPAKYKVAFLEGEKTTPAIGEFNLQGNVVNGSFLTQSGDYRFLEGKLNGQNLTLFGFDGGFLQVFKARLQNDTLRGFFYSGLTGFSTWTAAPNDTFALPNPDVVSELNPKMDSISFSYPGIDGQAVSYNPSAFKNKVVVLQITGSWCPNCKDQARFLQQLKNEFGGQGLEILGIAFERMGTLEKSIAAAKKSKDDLKTDYRVGVAKYNRDQIAEEVFPFITKIRSYPTLLIIDKKGAVRKIYTGFAGPGTTQYSDVTNGLTQFINTLLHE